MTMKRIACPECGKNLRYKEEHAGRRVRCSLCGYKFRLEPPEESGQGGTAVAIKTAGATRTNVTARTVASGSSTRWEEEDADTPSRPARGRTRKKVTPVALVAALLLVGVAAGGGYWVWQATHPTPPPYSSGQYQYPPGYGPYGAGIVGNFKDDAATNTDVQAGALELAFVDQDGKTVDLRKFRGQKHLVLVVTRGFPGYVCPNCSTQVSRLITNYAEFSKRDAEVLVVFPGPTEHLADFLKDTKSKNGSTAVPFPILLDEDFKAIQQLGIKADLAKPSTYIVDKQGQVRFAYVGTTSTDRPSVKAILNQLDAIQKDQEPANKPGPATPENKGEQPK